MNELSSDRETFDAQRQLLRERKEEMKKLQLELRMRSDALNAQQASLDDARTALLNSSGGGGNDDTLTGGIVLDPDLAEGGSPARRQEDRLEQKRLVAELDERREALDLQQAELDQQRAELDERELALDGVGSADDLHALEQALAQRETELNEKEERLRAKFEAGKQKLVTERDRMADESIALEALAQDLEIQRTALAEERERLLDEGRELTLNQNDLGVQGASDDDGDVTVAGVAFHEGDAEALDQITGPDDGVENETAAETAAAAAAAATALAEAEAKIAEADARAAELDGLAATLDEKREDLHRQSATLNEREQALQQAEAELGDRRADPGSGLNSMDLEAYARELRERSEALKQRESEVVTREDSLAAGLGDPGPTVAPEADPDEVAALRAELDQMRTKYETRKAQMMKADEVIKGRRQKIRDYLAQLREQSAKLRDAQSEADASTGQAAGLEKERRNLVEVRKFLEMSEHQMVTQWSKRSASNVAAVVIFAVAAAATASYFAARAVVHPVWQATMAMSFDPAPTATAPDPAAVRAAVEAGLPASPAAEPGVDTEVTLTEAADASPTRWLNGFRQRLTSESVLQSTLDDLNGNLSVRLFDGTEALAERLATGLRVNGPPEAVQFTYLTTDREHADDLLQNLSHAVVGDQMQRHDGRTARVIAAPLRSDQPVRDDTNLYMAAIFLAQIAVGLLLTVVLRLFFARATRVLHPGAGGPAMAVLSEPIR